MKIKLVKDLNELKAGSIVEVDDAKSDEYVKEGHILYTAEVETKEKAEAVQKVTETIKEDLKMENKEVKKEIEAPAVIIKNEKRIDTIGDLASKMLHGEVKELHITQKAPAGMNEDTANADGGFLVSHDISNEIYGRLFEGGKIWPKVKKVQVGPNYNGMKLPYLNITTQTNTSQPRLYSLAEGATKTPTKFTFGQHDLSLVKLIALVPITEELLQDKVQLESYVFSQLKGQFAWRCDYNALYGTAGTTGNIGILDATGAAFLASPVAHGAAATIGMINSLINSVAPQVRDGAEFYMSGDMWANCMSVFGPGVGSMLYPVATEQGAVRRLQGYPVNIVDGMPVRNTAKDILFMNASEIVALEKGGITIDISKEFYFDTDQVALRWVYRSASAPVYAGYTANDTKFYAAASATS